MVIYLTFGFDKEQVSKQLLLRRRGEPSATAEIVGIDIGAEIVSTDNQYYLYLKF